MANGKHPSSYSKFTKTDIADLGIKIRGKDLFPNVQALSPSEWLVQTLQRAPDIRLATEKAKSEFLITPVLSELQNLNPDKLALFSGIVPKVYSIDKYCQLSKKCQPKKRHF